jgi:hypothetical protein
LSGGMLKTSINVTAPAGVTITSASVGGKVGPCDLYYLW